MDVQVALFAVAYNDRFDEPGVIGISEALIKPHMREMRGISKEYASNFAWYSTL